MSKSNKFELLKSIICILLMIAVSAVFVFAYVNEYNFFHPIIIYTLIITLILQYTFLRKYFFI